MAESSYMVAPGETNDSLALRKKVALALAQRTMQPPQIDHWTQGLAHMADSAYSGYEVGKIARDEKEESAKGNAILAALFSGQPAPVSAPAPTAPAAPSPNKGYGDAIASIESGGKYDVLGPVTKTGDRAYGKYQVMGANVPAWTKAHLGQEMNPEDFLRNPQAQDAVFNGQFNQYVSKYGPEGAAKAWFAGERGMNNPNARDQLGTTVAAYGNKFAQALGAQPQSMPQARPGGGINREAIVQMLGNRKTAPIAQKIIADQIAQQFKPQSTDDIKEYEYAKRNGFQGSLGDWMGIKRGGAGEYGLQPIWGVDEQGNPAITQLGKGGKAVQSQLPPGFKIARDPIKIDGGTEWILLDPQTRQPVGRQPKNIEQTKAAGEIGEAAGKAKVALPAAESTTKRALTMLDQIEHHPGLSEGVGFVLGRLPALTPKAADFRERVEQLDAMIFGDAVEVMRGLGALTDREGPKVTAARARLKTAKSEEDYRTALKDIREVFKTSIENMRTKAGAATPGAAPQADPLGIR